MVAVVGHVGAGKLSLISALLGEMEKITGHVMAKVSMLWWLSNRMMRCIVETAACMLVVIKLCCVCNAVYTC